MEIGTLLVWNNEYRGRRELGKSIRREGHLYNRRIEEEEMEIVRTYFTDSVNLGPEGFVDEWELSACEREEGGV